MKIWILSVEASLTQCQTGRIFSILGRVLVKILGSGRAGVLKYTIGYFWVSFLLSGISGYSWVFPGISGYIGYHLFFLEVVSQTLRFFLTLQKFTNNLQIKITVGQIQDCRGVIPEIPSHVWEYPKYRVIPETSGLPEISGNTRYFGLPATR